MNHSVRAGVVGLLLSLLLVAGASAGPTASVRVEGQNATLLPATAVTLPDAGGPCGSSNTGFTALHLATKGDWDRQEYTQTVLGETHKFDNNDFWALWVKRGGKYVVANGLCSEQLATGEELLVAYQEADPVTFAFQRFPLWVTDVPATVQAGTPFTVKVNRTACETDACNPGEGRAEPAAGATVTAAGVTATTDAAGVATLTLPEAGAAQVQATAPYGTRSAPVATTVTAAPAPGHYYPIPTPTATPTVTAVPTDTVKPSVRIRGLKAKYRKRKAPRKLRARVRDAGGIADVKLALTRTRKGKCYGFGDRRGKFRRIKCGRRLLFSVGAQANVSYLLPKKLGRGKYRFDVIGIDPAGNRTAKRKRFRVR